MNEARVLRAVDIFTPTKYPEHTFVPRINKDYSVRVSNAFMTPNMIVSVSGPSKCGKSVLIQQGAGDGNLIHIHGAQIREADDLWRLVLAWMDSPTTLTTAITDGARANMNTSISGTIGIPKTFTVQGNLGYTKGENSSITATNSTPRFGIDAVAREIADSDFVVFVDDFHYIPSVQTQQEVAKHIKAAAERGIKVCLASVTHRADDAVRSNPELRGRVQSIDIEYWSEPELVQIGEVGFGLLRVEFDSEFIQKLAREACGSPQLMQSLCLQTCFRFGIREASESPRKISVQKEDLIQILENTSTLSDFSTMVEKMHDGPKTRGQERKEFQFKDGSRGDVYRAVLLALREDPPVMTLPYQNLIERIQSVAIADSPGGSSVSQACLQIDSIATQLGIAPDGSKSAKPIELDQSSDVETLNIVDPYFLFYLRASSKLNDLGRFDDLGR